MLPSDQHCLLFASEPWAPVKHQLHGGDQVGKGGSFCQLGQCHAAASAALALDMVVDHLKGSGKTCPMTEHKKKEE